MPDINQPSSANSPVQTPGPTAPIGFGAVEPPASPAPVANNTSTNPPSNIGTPSGLSQQQTTNTAAPGVSGASEPSTLSGALEFRKGPFDEKQSEPMADGVAVQSSNTQMPPALAAADESDHTTALRKSLGLDEKKGEDVKTTTQPNTDATFPTVAQVDQAKSSGFQPIPKPDDEKKSDSALEKLMDEIIWDLAGIQAKIRQMKDEIEASKVTSKTEKVADTGRLENKEVKSTEKNSSNDGVIGYNIE
jgi:hypothetical protein